MDHLSSSVSAITNQHNLDNLPDLIYRNLFKYLNVEELSMLKSVSKKLYTIVNDYNITELAFFKDEYCRENWFSTVKPIKLLHQMRPYKRLDLIRNPPNNFLNLKYLKIDCLSYGIKLEDLNKFTKLQILDIDDGIKRCSYRSDLPRTNYLIQLPDLKAFSIKIGTETASPLMIDAPSLHCLSIHQYYNGNYDFDHIFDAYYDEGAYGYLGRPRNEDDSDHKFIAKIVRIKYPGSIKHLRINYYDKKALIFENLEHLEFDGGFEKYLKQVNNFKHLNKLQVYHEYALSDSVVSKLKDLFNSKKNSLEIIVDGVKIKTTSKLDEHIDMHLNVSDNSKFQLSNHADLCNDLHFVTSLVYNNLVSLVPNPPSDLFSKYSNIQRIYIEKSVADENRLIDFIGKCYNLYFLRVRYSSLDQQFYDRLTEKSFLSILEIDEQDMELNFKFVMKMPYLKRLETNLDVLTDEKLNFSNLKHLKELVFKINNCLFTIYILGVDSYKVSHPGFDQSNSNYGYCNLAKIIQWSKEIRNKKND